MKRYVSCDDCICGRATKWPCRTCNGRGWVRVDIDLPHRPSLLRLAVVGLGCLLVSAAVVAVPVAIGFLLRWYMEARP